ncbi:hypothetical protein AB0O87_00800 [Microbacterium sp. NPDC076768]|uniref:hypothetical protein n=1 Tax=Microbacterium sp. NPDC076768 TaxID=3154858 RepID=UPI003422D581
MWIETSRQLPSNIDQKITAVIGRREDREDTVWLDLSSGGRIVLAANGGWRTANKSAFHALYVSPTGEISNATHGLLGRSVPFDTSETGAGTYSARMRACVAHIEKVLGATVHRVNV